MIADACLIEMFSFFSLDTWACMLELHVCYSYSKTKDKTKIFMTNGSLMKVESIAEFPLENSAILLACIK